MGVDTKIMLPGDVRIQDVAEVIGILAGLPKTKFVLQGDDGSWAVRVSGVKVEGIPNLASCAQIYLNAQNGTPFVDGEMTHMVMFHYEPGEGSGERLLMPRSTAFWIAMGEKLIEFFGGEQDYNDCDSKDVDISCKKPRKRNNPSDGKPWQDFEKAMWSLKPLTEEEVIQAAKQASYGLPEFLEKKLKGDKFVPKFSRAKTFEKGGAAYKTIKAIERDDRKILKAAKQAKLMEAIADEAVGN